MLVVSSRAQYLEKAQRWIRELDTTASGASYYMATYPLQNRSATEVAPLLNDLLKSGGSEDGNLATEGDPTESNSSSGQTRVAADDSRNAQITSRSKLFLPSSIASRVRYFSKRPSQK